MPFFSYFHGNVTVLVPKLCRKTPPCCHAPIWSKKVHSVKTTLFHGRKKSKGSPLFPIFTNKLLLSLPIFCKKTSILLKHITLMPIFFRKTSFLSKTLCSHGIIFKFYMKNPLQSCLFLIKKPKNNCTLILFYFKFL